STWLVIIPAYSFALVYVNLYYTVLFLGVIFSLISLFVSSLFLLCDCWSFPLFSSPCFVTSLLVSDSFLIFVSFFVSFDSDLSFSPGTELKPSINTNMIIAVLTLFPLIQFIIVFHTSTYFPL